MKKIDLHCDTIAALMEKNRMGKRESLRQNRGHVDLYKLKKGGAMLQNFALFIDKGETGDPLEEALLYADYYYNELEANKDCIAPVFCWEDIERNREEGKLSALLTVEEGGVCKGNPAFLRTLYRLGVRMMTLTWNYPNEIGYPNLRAGEHGKQGTEPFYRIPDEENGLTDIGFELIEQMENMGMMIDVSHLSDAGFYDVLRHTKKPFFASHSNARAICPWVRNLTDDMISRLAERGGIIGINFCPDFLTEVSEGEGNKGTIEGIIRHIQYITNVGGIDCIGLGSDFDGIAGHGELPDYSCMPRLEQALERAGFGINAIEKILYKNVLRVYRELL